jgi:hypothetical protein
VPLDFALRDLAGTVRVALEPDDDRGFPVCTATVEYAGRGYAAMLGWIQLVRSTDNASGGEEFEVDPYEPLGRQSHPFCWFGVAPTLFDAPSRRTDADLDWTAHTFLGFVAETNEVRALLGFGWGFVVRDGVVTLAPAEPLVAGTWDAHLPLLRREYPTWEFGAGYRDR